MKIEYHVDRWLMCVHVQYAVKKTERPPIINTASYTLASPYKEQRHHRTPSESIANNYTPTVQDIKIREIARRFKRPRKGLQLFTTVLFLLACILLILILHTLCHLLSLCIVHVEWLSNLCACAAYCDVILSLLVLSYASIRLLFTALCFAKNWLGNQILSVCHKCAFWQKWRHSVFVWTHKCEHYYSH